MANNALLASLLGTGKAHDPRPIGGRSRELSQLLLSQSLGGQVRNPIEGIGKLAQAWASRSLADRAVEQDKARNEQLASALAPESWQDVGGGGVTDVPSIPGFSVESPNIQDANAERRNLLATMLGSNIGSEAISSALLKQAGLGSAADPIKLGKDDRLFAPDTYKELIGVAPPPPKEIDYNKPFLADGTPNRAYQEYSLREKMAGRPSTTVNVSSEKPFSQALGGSAAGLLEASSAAARGGAQTLNTVSQIRQALDSGKVTAGPGTTALQFFGQISGGDPQRLQATRATMQGLAKLTLDARGALKGQGTITDREQALLERAVSGDIDSLSIPEIRTITDVADRAARASIKANAENVNRARNIPGAGPVLDFFAVPEPALPAQSGAVDDLLKKYGAGK